MLKNAITALALSVTLGGVAFAGAKYSYPVYLSTGFARGNLGAVRNSTDDAQLIGCSVSFYASGSPYGSCHAWDANNNSRYCSTTNAALITAIQSLRGDDYLYFAFNTSTGVCTEIGVTSSSEYEPKQP